jgi:hypothetical protein
LEAGIAANYYYGVAVDPESVTRAEVDTITVLWNAVAIVAAALLPGAVLGLEATCAMLLPDAPLLALPATRLLRGSIGLLLPRYLLPPDLLLLLLLNALLLLPALFLLLLLLPNPALVWLRLARYLLRVRALLWLRLLTTLLLLSLFLLRLLPNPALLRLRLARYLLWVLLSLWLLLLLLTALLFLSVLAFSRFAFVLLLLIFVLLPCVGERSDPEHYQQNSCADKSDFLHPCTSVTG